MKTKPQRVVACEHYLDAATALRNDGKYPSALMSAQEALAKWEFAPALRYGVAVDVDALFEIPFHLAPRPTQ